MGRAAAASEQGLSGEGGGGGEGDGGEGGGGNGNGNGNGGGYGGGGHEPYTHPGEAPDTRIASGAVAQPPPSWSRGRHTAAHTHVPSPLSDSQGGAPVQGAELSACMQSSPLAHHRPHRWLLSSHLSSPHPAFSLVPYYRFVIGTNLEPPDRRASSGAPAAACLHAGTHLRTYSVLYTQVGSRWLSRLAPLSLNDPPWSSS